MSNEPVSPDPELNAIEAASARLSRLGAGSTATL